MTKEITKAYILQQLQDKFKLREFEDANFLFSETVCPVYNIEQHIETIKRLSTTRSITTSGSVSFHTVPDDEQWRLHRYNVIFVTGVYTVAGVHMGRPSSASYTYLDLTAAQNVSYAHDLPKDVKMESGDKIYVNVDSYTSAGDLTVIVEVTKETIR